MHRYATLRYPMLRSACLVGASLVASLAQATLPIGQIPPVIEFKGESGSTVSGEPWSSASLAAKGAVHLLVYSTVGEKDTNNETTAAVKKAEFDKSKFSSVAVINMASSWQPNYFIDKALKSKQEEYPNTLYVRDLKNVVVKEWKLADKSNNLVLFDKAGKVLFSVDGKLTGEQKDRLVKMIGDEVKKG